MVQGFEIVELFNSAPAEVKAAVLDLLLKAKKGGNRESPEQSKTRMREDPEHGSTLVDIQAYGRARQKGGEKQ